MEELAAVVVDVFSVVVVGCGEDVVTRLLFVVPLVCGGAKVVVDIRSSKDDQSKIPPNVVVVPSSRATVVTDDLVGTTAAGARPSHHRIPNEMPASSPPSSDRINRSDASLHTQMLFQNEDRPPLDASSAMIRATCRASSSGLRRLRSLGPGTRHTSPESPSAFHNAKAA